MLHSLHRWKLIRTRADLFCAGRSKQASRWVPLALVNRSTVTSGSRSVVGSSTAGAVVITCARRRAHIGHGLDTGRLGLRKSLIKWRPRRDSNPCYRRERAMS